MFNLIFFARKTNLSERRKEGRGSNLSSQATHEASERSDDAPACLLLVTATNKQQEQQRDNDHNCYFISQFKFFKPHRATLAIEER